MPTSIDNQPSSSIDRSSFARAASPPPASEGPRAAGASPSPGAARANEERCRACGSTRSLYDSEQLGELVCFSCWALWFGLAVHLQIERVDKQLARVCVA